MEQKDFKILVDTAKARLDYFVSAEVWLSGYIQSAEKTSIDGVKVDTSMVHAVKELRNRIIEEITKDAIFISKHNITGVITWHDIPNLT